MAGEPSPEAEHAGQTSRMPRRGALARDLERQDRSVALQPLLANADDVSVGMLVETAHSRRFRRSSPGTRWSGCRGWPITSQPLSFWWCGPVPCDARCRLGATSAPSGAHASSLDLRRSLGPPGPPAPGRHLRRQGSGRHRRRHHLRRAGWPCGQGPAARDRLPGEPSGLCQTGQAVHAGAGVREDRPRGCARPGRDGGCPSSRINCPIRARPPTSRALALVCHACPRRASVGWSS
jgi:hypothetical protein